MHRFYPTQGLSILVVCIFTNCFCVIYDEFLAHSENIVNEQLFYS